MPSLFAALGQIAGATVDAVFSEGFMLEPMAPPQPAVAGRRPNVNLRMTASTARPQIPFSGTYVEPGELMNAHGRTKADSTTHWVVGAKAMVDAAVAAMPQRPMERDRIVRLDTGDVFEVAKVIPGDYGRLRIFLVDAVQRPEEPR